MGNEPDTLLAARRWALISIIGTIVYVILDVVVQLLPPHYSPLREAESNLAVGPYGYIMNLNFLIRGVFSFSVIMAIQVLARESSVRIRGTIFFGIWSAGSFLLGFFNTDVIKYSGNRMGLTFHGMIHLLLALAAFVCAPIGEILLSVSFGKIEGLKFLRTPALSLAVLSSLMLLLQFRGFRGMYFGLFERLFIGSVLLWGLVVCVKVRGLKNTSPL